MNKQLDMVLAGLMNRYIDRVPDVKKITQAMVTEGVISGQKEIQNDHIAFRTMGVPQLGIQSLERIFLHLGYKKRDYYYFEKKKLDAYWYSPPEPHYPRIFISELKVEELSTEAQKIIKSYTDEVTEDPINHVNLDSWQEIDQFLHSPLWRTPSYDDFSILQSESEYASWVIYNRYYLNHYTISVHNLPSGYNTISEFNEFLENIGVILNSSGGKSKTSNDGLLIQSSTVAQMVDAHFANDVTHKISGSYVEFAERQIKHEFRNLNQDELKDEHRRDGFEAANADKIFESTYTTQTKKHD